MNVSTAGKHRDGPPSLSSGPLTEFYPQAAAAGIDKYLPRDTFASSPAEQNDDERDLEEGQLSVSPAPGPAA